MTHARHRILIVDDEGIIALDLRQKLTAMGYDVPAIAHSADQAIDKVVELRPDLVLMDIRLEGSAMDGVATADIIREHFGTPVVFVTAYADASTMDRASLIGPYGYVVKPFTEVTLRIAVEIAIHTSQTVALLRRQARQQATIAEISQVALRETDLPALLDDTVVRLSQALDLECCHILEAEGSGGFKVRARMGWHGGAETDDRLAAALAPQARATLSEEHPVIVENFRGTGWVEQSPLLTEHGIVSGISTPIRDAGNVFGVLGAFSASSRSFSADDISFVQVTANVISQAIQRQRAEYRLQRARDEIAERKLREQERIELLAREQTARLDAEAANRAKDEFLAVVSHELRTPLNIIMGWASLLEGGKLEPEAAGEAMKIIERNSRFQARLIDDILDVSRINSGKLYTEFSAIHVAPVVASAVDAVRPDAASDGVTLEITVEPGDDLIWGDAQRLQQVMSNLLSNALKFTGRDGWIRLLVVQLNEKVVVTVRDSGAGIDPKFLPHVFEHFRQADASSTREHGGLGLGLAIVRHLVEVHGGSVTAASSGNGAGASFSVELPLALPEPGNGADTLQAPSWQGALDGLRVLVVDDEDETCELLAHMLRLGGATVQTATSATAALEQLDAAWPDVLVSDLALPGDAAFSLLAQVRAMEPRQGAALRALAISAATRAGDRQAALAAGFEKHLAKPVTPQVLVSTVADLMRIGQTSLAASSSGVA